MKNPSKSQVGLKKLPEDVRNQMGYFADGGSVEIDGVMDESYVEPHKASKKGGTKAGNSRGGGAALRGTKFSGVK